MWWPFGKDKLEKRAAQPYTDLVTNYLESQAAGDTTRATTLAAVEAAAGQYARAFAGAEVQASAHVKAALTPSVLALMARNMIRYGESVHIIQVMRGAMSLLAAGSFDVRGGINEEEWIYNVHIYGPSGNLSSFIPSASTVHCRYSVDSSQPWRGISPLGWSATTARLLSNLENNLASEMGGPSGYFLPVPIDSAKKEDNTGPLDKLRADLNNIKGRTVLVESVANGWGEGKANAPQKDWVSERIGPNPPSVLATLRSDAAQSILSACGVPSRTVYSPQMEAHKAAREVVAKVYLWECRTTMHGSLKKSYTRKLESPVSLSFSGHAYAADICRKSKFSVLPRWCNQWDGRKQSSRDLRSCGYWRNHKMECCSLCKW